MGNLRCLLTHAIKCALRGVDDVFISTGSRIFLGNVLCSVVEEGSAHACRSVAELRYKTRYLDLV
jgi:hypothetical protein